MKHQTLIGPRGAGPPRSPLAAIATGVIAMLFASAAVPAQAIECTTFVKQELARQRPTLDYSGLTGDAGTWYRAARRNVGASVVGSVPSRGAIMVFAGNGDAGAFPAYASFAAAGVGHVALVSTVVDSRNITVDHANWRKGKVDLGVMVTTADGWRTASVENRDTRSMGGGRYAVAGFISPALFPRKKK